MSFVADPTVDLDSFFLLGRILYLFAFLTWVVWLLRSGRSVGFLAPTFLALLFWAINTYPMQRPYGLFEPGDRLRNLWWSATAAAGNSPWESGVGGGASLEPFWATLVSVLALRDPGLVIKIYPFLPALGIILMGLSLGTTFRRSVGRRAAEHSPGPSDGDRCALFVVFFVLLASTQPLDYIGAYHGSLWKTILLKPNHVLGFALVPVCAAVVAGPMTVRRSVLAVALIGLLGWVFVIHWVLFSWCVVLFAVVGLLTRISSLTNGIRLLVILLLASILVAPYVYFLRTNFETAVSLSPSWTPGAPKLSPWGESPPRGYSLLFIVTVDLGLNFFLALWGSWAAWRRRSRFDLMWLSIAAGTYSAWAVSAVLYETGRARGAAHVYVFVMFTVAVFAGLGAMDLVQRFASWFTPNPQSRMAALNRITAGVLLLLLPVSVPWWFRPHVMDSHFRAALDPLPGHLVSLGTWIRSHTRGSDTFLAGPSIAPWIPALSGRRVLGIGRAPHDSPSYWDECAIVFPANVEEAREVAVRLRLAYVVADPSLLEEHVLPWDHFDRDPFFEKVHEDGSIRVYHLRYP